MFILLHGDDIDASRNALNLFRTGQDEVISFDGKKITIDELTQAAESVSLFGEKRLIIIENLFSKGSKEDLKNITSYLSSVDSSYDIIIWEGKSVGKRETNKLGDIWQIKEFSIPKIIFTLMESIKPGNNKRMIELIKIAREYKASDEFIFLMMVRQIRMLLLAKENGLSGMPSWMAGKFSKQAGYFETEELILLYKKLLGIDIKQKTGSSAYPIGGELDLLLASL